MVIRGEAIQSVVAAGVCVSSGEIGRRALLRDGWPATLPQRGLTEEADGVYLFIFGPARIRPASGGARLRTGKV